MGRKSIMQAVAIATNDPEEFEEKFNEAMRLLADNRPEVTLDLSEGLKAVITYELSEETIETIGDQFRAEGIRHICRECPLHDYEADSRRKWVSCRYSELGETHLDHECCEYFYKMLKIGQIRPGTHSVSGRMNSAKVRK